MSKKLSSGLPQLSPTRNSDRSTSAVDPTLASVERQIDAFDGKVRKFKEGYSTDAARLMFAELARLLTGNGGEPAPAALTTAASSIARLRLLLSDRRLATAAGPVRQFFSWYMQNVDYAAELLRNYDKLIYTPLMDAIATFDDYSDDENDDSVAGEDAEEGERRRSSERAALLSLADEIPELRSLVNPPAPPLAATDVDPLTARLDRVRAAWSRLLADGNDRVAPALALDQRLLSADAARSAWLSAWVRLLPDVAEQCERASALVRRLVDAVGRLAEAQSETADSATAAAEKARAVRRALEALGERMRASERNAEAAERQLIADGSDLESLLEREERSAALEATEHSLAQESQRLGDAAAALRRELADTVELLATAHRGGDFADKLAATARLRRRRLAALEQTLACVDYQRRIVHEDLALEMSARPSIIQFTNHAQERCERLEQTAERANNDRARLTLAIAALERRERRLHLRAITSSGT